jgi:prepilin-type N-terminal cleavage/methylation domain-containing protein
MLLEQSRKRQYGFSLVELLVAMVVIGILASIAFANYTATQIKAKNASVKGNMHTTSIAAEAYATDCAGLYPPSDAAMLPYFPGGNSSIGGVSGKRPTNPYTSVPDEPLYAAGLSSAADINSARATTPVAKGSVGQVGYSQSDEGLSYAVLGTGGDGKTLSGLEGNTLVLSNR